MHGRCGWWCGRVDRAVDRDRGTINASGAGGIADPTSNNTGGAGGGSGGMIVLDSQNLSIASGGIVFANGGGGGEGRSTSNAGVSGDIRFRPREASAEPAVRVVVVTAVMARSVASAELQVQRTSRVVVVAAARAS